MSRLVHSTLHGTNKVPVRYCTDSLYDTGCTDDGVVHVSAAPLGRATCNSGTELNRITRSRLRFNKQLTPTPLI